jgi:tripartite-type tricarboxylate transporter receptor subunit TctC
MGRLNKSVNDALRSAELKERFAALGADAVGSSTSGFSDYIGVEIAKWGKVIKAAGIKSE